MSIFKRKGKYMTITEKNGGILVRLPYLSLADTLDCGQCFRWETSDNCTFRGCHNGHFLTVSQQNTCQPHDETEIFFHNTTREEFETVWRPYFDLDTDYHAMQQVFRNDPTLALACDYAGGIRILRQDPWEALCSFIISQNNNIPRIKGIITRLCETFGDHTADGTTFPRPERIAGLSLDDLSSLRAGFRAKYILDAAQKIANGEIELSTVAAMPIDEARKVLQTIRGVGPKVAECALLFGFYRREAFPIDTWIKKVLNIYYPSGFPDFAVPDGGVAQQYLFHYVRNHPLPV